MIYPIQNTKTLEYKELNCSYEDYKKFLRINPDWIRIFTAPQIAVDGKICPNSPNKFVEKTGKMKGSYGDLMDFSAELSERRKKEHGGVDPVANKFYQDYSAKRRGRKHQSDPNR